MKKAFSFLTLFVFLFSCAEKEKPGAVVMKSLTNYPSASGIEYFDNKFYVIGDDARSVLILGNSLSISDSISLYNFSGYRFPKEIKPDLEGITVMHVSNRNYLFITGSGSLSPYRDTAWILDIRGKEKIKLSLDSVFQYLKKSGELKEINIEGAGTIDSILILANRGHLNNRKNWLITCENLVSTENASPTIKIIDLENPSADSTTFSGVSGIAYSADSDRLFLTFSTELTTSSFTDGAIGNSYLWIINKFSEKLNLPALNPDRVIDLNAMDPVFKGHKIESVCILNEEDGKTWLAMVADNDNGSSSIFKLSVKIN